MTHPVEEKKLRNRRKNQLDKKNTKEKAAEFLEKGKQKLIIANSNFAKPSSHSKQGWTEVLDPHTSHWADITTMEKYTPRH